MNDSWYRSTQNCQWLKKVMSSSENNFLLEVKLDCVCLTTVPACEFLWEAETGSHGCKQLRLLDTNIDSVL